MGPKKIALEISKALDDRRETLESVAKKTGVSVSQISRFSQGNFKRVSKGLVKVCSELSVSLAESTKVDKELESAVLNAWDGTEKQKQNIMKMLRLLSGWG